MNIESIKAELSRMENMAERIDAINSIKRMLKEVSPFTTEPVEMEKKRDVPSWKRICRTLLRNDYWCKGLGFSPTKQSAYETYIKRIKAKRNEWGIFSDNLEV